jgi:hypothetical protein
MKVTHNEYSDVDLQFLKGIAVVVSVLFIIWMFILGKNLLICLSIVNTFWFPATHGGPRSAIVVVSALFGLCSYLLFYVEISMPLTYSVPTTYYWGYCKGISAAVHYNNKFYCSDGYKPETALTEWMVQTMQNSPTLKTFLIMLPYGLPFIAATLIAYSYFSSRGEG